MKALSGFASRNVDSQPPEELRRETEYPQALWDLRRRIFREQMVIKNIEESLQVTRGETNAAIARIQNLEMQTTGKTSV